jgi:hypothetical protein
MNWLLALLILAGILLFIWWLTRKPFRMTHGRWTHGYFSRGFHHGGHSVWCYEGGTWRLMEDHSAPGFVPGPPPAQPGTFEGECVKVTSVRGPGAR